MAEIVRLTNSDELDSHVSASHERDVWIFKHSLSCGISSAAWRHFEKFAEASAEEDGLRFAVIEIQRARELSRAVAERFGVRHESPQAFLVRRGEVVWHASHWDIDSSSLESAS